MAGPFCKLANQGEYVACQWNLTTDEAGRVYWVALFKKQVSTILEQVRATSGPDGIERMDRCVEEFRGQFDAFLANPTPYGRVSILTFDQWRDRILRKHGFIDPYLQIKDRENAASLAFLPAVCAELDGLKGADQLWAVITGLFAGNLFDMGAGELSHAFLAGCPDFFRTRSEVRPRPWLIDDYDALSHRLLNRRVHRKAVFFIDNAGSDFILGAIPMMRWLSQRGTKVVLAANERPTLNDMTIHDVNAWWPRIVAAEPSIAAAGIERVSTGTGEPLIDLMQVSDELNAAAADADLVILEGMGRGVESNLEAGFSCDALNVAMIKDRSVAQRHGGKVFDLVCRFR